MFFVCVRKQYRQPYKNSLFKRCGCMTEKIILPVGWFRCCSNHLAAVLFLHQG